MTTIATKLPFWSTGPSVSQFLSNFWPCSVNYKGIEFPSAEHAYQWAKLADKTQFEGCLTDSAAAVKRKSSSFVRVPGWDDIRLQVMREVLDCKFAQNSGLMDLALTLYMEGAVFEHEASWDLYWGCSKGTGLNWQGKLISELMYTELLARATSGLPVINDSSKVGNPGYVGRGSKWGNPIKISGAIPRDEAIRRFCAYLKDSPLLSDLNELRNALYCFCAPQHCHGDVLACARYISNSGRDPRAWLDAFAQTGYNWEQPEIVQTSLF